MLASCFLIFTSLVSVTGFYTEDGPFLICQYEHAYKTWGRGVQTVDYK